MLRMKNNIAVIRKAKGIRQEDLAEAIGLHVTNLNRIELGKSNPKNMDKYQEIADSLGVDLAELFAIPADSSDERGAPFGVELAGTAQAGAFFEVDLHSEPVRRYVAIAPDPRYRRARQFVWQIKGDSMNKAGIQDGMFALGVDYGDFIDKYRPVESGDIVVVERLRFSGQERELTIKRYWEEKEGVALIPESTNEHHKTIFIPRNSVVEGEEIRIVGYVTGAYHLFGQAVYDLDEGQMVAAG